MSLTLNFYTQFLDSWRAIKQDLDRLLLFCRSNQFVPSESHKTVFKTSLAGKVQPPPAWAYVSSGKSPSSLFHTNGAGSTAAALEGERSSPEICKVTTSLSINSPLNIVKSVFSSCQTQLLPSKFCDLLSSFALWIVRCPASSPKAMTGELMDSGIRLHITNKLNIFQVQIY